MENLNILNIVLALLGVLIHILMKIADRNGKAEDNKKWSFKIWRNDRMNWVRLALSLCSIATLLLLADDLADMWGISLSDGSPAKGVLAFGAGYLNHSLIRNVMRSFKKGVPPIPNADTSTNALTDE